MLDEGSLQSSCFPVHCKKSLRTRCDSEGFASVLGHRRAAARVDRLYAHSTVPFLDFSISKDGAHAPMLCTIATEAQARAALQASAVLKFLLACDTNRGSSQSVSLPWLVGNNRLPSHQLASTTLSHHSTESGR